MAPACCRDALGRQVAFAEDCIGEAAEAAVAAMKDGDVLLLENLRFHDGEEKPTTRLSSRQLAKLGDLYVNDAFSAAHRAHASTEGLARKLPADAGTLDAARARSAGDAALGNPKRPVVAMVGGAKVSTKLDLLGNLVGKVDALVIGGGMANTFLARARASRSASRWPSATSPTRRAADPGRRPKGRSRRHHAADRRRGGEGVQGRAPRNGRRRSRRCRPTR